MAVAQKKPSAAALKDLYAVGEIPPLGYVPADMHAGRYARSVTGHRKNPGLGAGSAADLADRR